MCFINLTEEESILVNKLEKESPNHITRLHCNLLKLSNKKLSMKELRSTSRIPLININL